MVGVNSIKHPVMVVLGIIAEARFDPAFRLVAMLGSV